MTDEDNVVRINPRFLSAKTEPDTRTVWDFMEHYSLLYNAWRGAEPLLTGRPFSHQRVIEGAVWCNLTTVLVLAVWAHNAGKGVRHEAFDDLMQVHAATSDVAGAINLGVLHAEVFGLLRKSLHEQRTTFTRLFDRIWPDADWQDPHPQEP